MSGTGGNFLCHLIVSAKQNNKTITLSEYGNVHFTGFKDIPGPPWGVDRADIDKINMILTTTPRTNLKPYYTIGHIVNVDLLSQYFKKFIRIIYDEDDIDEITRVFVGKWGIDGENLKNSPAHLNYYLFENRNRTEFYMNYFSYDEKYNESLFVTWKELYHLESNILINKLHSFTNIPVENFSTDMIQTWRNGTTLGLEKLNNLL